MISQQKRMRAKKYWEARRKECHKEIAKAKKLRGAISRAERGLLNAYLKTLRQLAVMCGKMAKSTQRAIDTQES
jgi:hypothetical protein